MTVSKRLKELMQAKRAALEQGDQETLHSAGEGKDVLSVLRE